MQHCRDETLPVKALHLNLVGSPKKGAEAARPSQFELNQSSKGQPREENDAMNSIRGPALTPSSSLELFTATEVGTSSVSSSNPGASPFFQLKSVYRSENGTIWHKRNSGSR